MQEIDIEKRNYDTVSNMINFIVKNLNSDFVGYTHYLESDEISKINKNVVVLPNAIDPNESQFKEPTPESDRLRIGWLGGSSHLHDLMLLDGMTAKLTDIKDKLQYN